MNEQNMRARLAHFGLVPGIAALDLITKAWARADLRYGESVEILPFFNLTLGFNRGVAFGLLNDAGDAVVLIVTAAISVMFGFWFWREPRALTRLGLAFVLGGAIGNFLDRLWRGEVTDFFDLHLFGTHWPAFNVADAAIACGVVLVVLDMLRGSKARGSKPGSMSSNAAEEGPCQP